MICSFQCTTEALFLSINQGVGTVLELPGIDTKLREVLKEVIASFMVRPQTKRVTSSLVILDF